MYREKLPENCPPSDAEEITAPRTVFRLVDSNPPEDRDFWSYYKVTQGRKPKGANRCEVRGLSVYTSLEGAKNCMLARPERFPNALICHVKLARGAGFIKRTGKAGHHTWWPFANFDIIAHCNEVSE